MESTNAGSSAPSGSKRSMLLNFRPSSFVSSRAQALRQRFANSKRSLSDSCKDVPLISTVSSSIGSDCSATPPNAQGLSGSPQTHHQPSRFQQRRGAVVPVPLPEYDPDQYGSPLGSPTHDSCLNDDGVYDLLGLSTPPNVTPVLPCHDDLSPHSLRMAAVHPQHPVTPESVVVVREEEEEEEEDEEDDDEEEEEAVETRRLLWQPETSGAATGAAVLTALTPLSSVSNLLGFDAVRSGACTSRSSPVSAAVSPVCASALFDESLPRPFFYRDADKTPDGPESPLVATNSPVLPVATPAATAATSPVVVAASSCSDQQRLHQTLQLLEHRGDFSFGTVRAAAATAVSVAINSSGERPDFKTDHDEPDESSSSSSAVTVVSPPTAATSAPPPPPSTVPMVSTSAPTTGGGGSSGRSGGCCMPLPSHPSPTPSPPSPTPPFHSAFITSPCKGSKGYGSGSGPAASSHSSMYSRSESIASISSGPGGCLSSLYSSLDRRSRMRLVHQMSMDETRCSVGRAATPAATAAAAAAAPAVANAVAAANVVSPTSSPDFAYRTLKSSNASTSSAAAAAISAAANERRKKRLLRKQTNSAPDSLEDSSQFTDRLCVTYYLDNVYNKGRNLYARRSWQGEEGQDMLLKVTPELGLTKVLGAKPMINLSWPYKSIEEEAAK